MKDHVFPIKNFGALMFLTVSLGLESDIEFLNTLIEYINKGFDPIRTLEFLKKVMVTVRDKNQELLEIHNGNLNNVIQYLESKEHLADLEAEGIKLRKEQKDDK